MGNAHPRLLKETLLDLENVLREHTLILAEGAVVRRGARVEHSVLMGGIEGGPDEAVTDESRAQPPASGF